MSQAKWNVASATQRELSANRKTYQAEVSTGNAAKQADQAKRDQQQAVASAEAAAVAQQTAETRAREADGKAQSAAVAQQQAEAKAEAADEKALDAEGRARNADTKTATLEKVQQLTQTGIRLDRASDAALASVEFGQVGALLRAIETGRELETALSLSGITVGSELASYPSVGPIYALQQVKAKINQTPKYLLAQMGEFLSLSFSPDGNQLITRSSSEDRIWDLENKTSKLLENYGSSVIGADFSPDGTQILSVLQDERVIIKNLKTGSFSVLETEDRGSEYQSSAREAISFSADGNQVVTTVGNDTARVWNLETGVPKALKVKEARIDSVSFSPDGTRVLTTEYTVIDGAIISESAKIWDLHSGDFTALEKPHESVHGARFSPRNLQVVTIASMAGDERNYQKTSIVRIWDLQTRESKILEEYQGEIFDAKFSPDGNYLLIIPNDGKVRIWNLRTGKVEYLEGHRAGVTSANFSPDSNQVITSSIDRTTRIWNLQTRESKALGGSTNYLVYSAFSPDGNRVVAASYDGIVQISDIKIPEADSPSKHQDAITSIAFSSDGIQIVTTSKDNTAQVWNLATNSLKVLSGHNQTVTNASFNSDGTYLATTSDDRTVRVWNLLNGDSISFEGYDGDATSIGFSADSSYVFTSRGYGNINQIWDLETGQHHLSEEAAPVRLRKDASLLLYPTFEGEIYLDDYYRDYRSTMLIGHRARITSAELDSGNNQLITASEDGTARIWDLTQIQDSQTRNSVVLTGHAGSVTSASFNSDGTFAVTTAEDGTARVWDLSGRQAALYEGDLAAFSPDGQQVAIVQNFGVKIFEVETLPKLIAWGCEWLHNYLEYGQATDRDRALCNLPPRTADADSIVPFQSSLGQTAEQIQVNWPQQNSLIGQTRRISAI
ncbi:hypothetical protein C7293_30640 [filamentous cyanobacterium CCT1]|nr:hypothetical protein C7293_30640 [filamentous cyanobacterium CCT1]